MKHLLISVLALSLIPLSLAAQEDPRKKPVVVPIPDESQYLVRRDVEYRKVESGRTLADIFIPADVQAKRPAVVFIPGTGGSKDTGQAQSYGALAAGAGLGGMVAAHRLNGLETLEAATGDVQAAVEFLRTNADDYSIDKDRVCLWFFSGSGLLTAPFLEERPEWLKCIVVYYGVTAPDVYRAWGVEVSDAQAESVDLLALLEAEPGRKPAIFVAEAGSDQPELNLALRRFTQAAAANAWPVEYWNHPTGPHAFDILQDDARSHEIVIRSLDFVKENLEPTR